jgi:CRP-like cAMP-binding protein
VDAMQFGIAEPPFIGELGTLVPTQTYPRGVELFTEGCALNEVLQVVSGVVKLTQLDRNGRQSIVGLAFPGEWLGTAPVIANTPTPASAVTCSHAVLRRLPGALFLKGLQTDPELSQRIHQAHALELCQQMGRIGQLCSLSSRKRLESVLRRFAAACQPSQTGIPTKLQLPFQLCELAAFIGVTPEHLSRLLKELDTDGLIQREKGWILVRDLERLYEDSDISRADYAGPSRNGSDARSKVS